MSALQQGKSWAVMRVHGRVVWLVYLMAGAKVLLMVERWECEKGLPSVVSKAAEKDLQRVAAKECV